MAGSKNWKSYITAFAKAKNVTDIIYYADEFPYRIHCRPKSRATWA